MYIGKRTPIENEEEQKNKVKICEDTMNICKNVEAQRVKHGSSESGTQCLSKCYRSTYIKTMIPGGEREDSIE